MTTPYIQLPPPSELERGSFTATVQFRDAGAAAVPTTASYRIDNVTSKTAIVPWTSLTPAASIDILVKSSDNRIISSAYNMEKRQIVVSADRGTDDETRSVAQWYVENLRGFDEE